jgi:hypothetical protein
MKKYNWVDVVSSNVEKIAYDDETKELLVGFKGGSKYYYVNVPKKLYEELLDSSSKGKFLNEKIKGDYGYGRI